MQNLDSLNTLTKNAKIALATICMEHAKEIIHGEIKLYNSVTELIQFLWRWQEMDKVSGMVSMSDEMAKTLPSFYLYDTFSNVLLKILKVKAQDSFVRGCNVLHGFVCWEMEAQEALLNPDKPFVLGNDIMDASIYWLVDGLDRIAKSASNPESEEAWQKKALEKLLQHHTFDGKNYIGTKVSRDFFDSIDQL